MAILKRNNNKTLALCDEIAKGTEIISATVIVSYMLETLAKSGSSFITATHLHELNNIKSITNLHNIKTKHIKISYDTLSDLLIFDRHLSDGPGESFYGLQVAKYLMKDKHFNERTNELLNEYQNITSGKVSKYNTQVNIESCEICKIKNNLETHHIIWQKDFDEHGINKTKLYLQKNDPYNLVVLCKYCHDKVDNGSILVNGWVDTSEGRKLDYQLRDPEKKSKYSQELINYIRALQNQGNEKLVKIKIKDKFNKKITSKSILKIWNSMI
jgi:DNA mismatch repair protein MutS